MELAAMKTHTEKRPNTSLRGIKLAALILGSSLVLAVCAGNPPSEQYAVTESAVNSAISAASSKAFPRFNFAMDSRTFSASMTAARIADRVSWMSWFRIVLRWTTRPATAPKTTEPIAAMMILGPNCIKFLLLVPADCTWLPCGRITVGSYRQSRQLALSGS